MRKPKKFWKSLRQNTEGQIISGYDGSPWVICEWREVPPPAEICVGLNCCENILDCFRYVIPDVLAEVEIKGKVITGDDKTTTQRMRIVRAWEWKKEDSVALAIFSARSCLKHYEDRYPNDNRPRRAIEAAEYYQQNPIKAATEAARAAAWAAAGATEAAARAAARAAAWAAWAAAGAAEAAAWAAWAAARAAAGAAEAAAWVSTKQSIHLFIVKRLEAKQELRQQAGEQE